LKPDPSFLKGEDRPVERVSWYDAEEFCARLSEFTKSKYRYRLPSEAEWEYACRARTTTPFYFGETITGDLANYDASNVYASEPKKTYRKETTPVGQFPPNAFGIYDMHGNVWEWCLDDWHDNYDGVPTNGSAWLNEHDNENSSCVLRGGSWYLSPDFCRSAYRDNYLSRGYRVSHFSFRVVCGVGKTLSP
jgi:formylglycine-generating enzyme required for sulfatase activity